MDYSKFVIEDFLCDNSFLEYCLGTNEEAVIFWTEWLKIHPEKVPAVNSARSLYYTLNGNISAEIFNKDFQVFKNSFNSAVGIEASARQPRVNVVIPIRKRNHRLIFSLAGIAATLLVMFGLFILKVRNNKQPVSAQTLSFETPLGKKRIVRLPDSSVVILNGGSQLEIVKGFNLKKREVILTGEGYFTVVHNALKPFIVHTHKINIKDIGTEFNIKAYSDDRTTEATLIKGRIEITINGPKLNHIGQNAIILSPDKKFVIYNNAGEARDNQPEIKHSFTVSYITTNPSTNSVVETDWKENKLTFYNESLENIALQIERWYGVKIVISNPQIKASRFTATFDHEDIAQVLKALKLSGNFNYRREGDVISIY